MITTVERKIDPNDIDYEPVAFMKFNGNMSIVKLTQTF